MNILIRVSFSVIWRNLIDSELFPELIFYKVIVMNIRIGSWKIFCHFFLKTCIFLCIFVLFLRDFSTNLG